MDIKNLFNAVIFTSAALSIKDALIEAVSKKANLYGANLRGANLYGADLRGASLRGADLSWADLREAYLRGADLYGAHLRAADLRGADLREADLRGADLYGANLRAANLRKANLRGADLYGAELYGAKIEGLTIAQLQFIPTEGAFIAWKKCAEGVIVKLSIPEDAKRSHGTGRKCRASKALVLDVIGAEFGKSLKKSTFEYRKGVTVVPDSFDEDRWEECSHGIHFYITKEEAIAHEG